MNKELENTIHLLVIEDSETSALLIESIFEENENIKIIISKSVKKALVLLNNYEFKLILLDLMLPKIDGYSFLKMIKQNSKFSEIPVVVISALTKEENIKKCFELGAIGFVPKPLGKNNLKDKVLELLEI